ncbi:hypothetical protein [Endozoicomonas sp.]|uniref:hypothetical protein n=1 Tax=Endozoicomonas sp. TaxID=1892382 RepID=UPI003AF67E40
MARKVVMYRCKDAKGYTGQGWPPKEGIITTGTPATDSLRELIITTGAKAKDSLKEITIIRNAAGQGSAYHGRKIIIRKGAAG